MGLDDCESQLDYRRLATVLATRSGADPIESPIRPLAKRSAVVAQTGCDPQNGLSRLA
jgi:hypothetical protein